MTRGIRNERSAVEARPEDPTLTPIHARCLAKLREHGGLIRLAGGYWVSPGSGFKNGKPAETWDIQTTIDALIRRGLAEYSAWRGGNGGEQYGTAIRPTKGA